MLETAGLAAFPFQGFDHNRLWCLIVALACDILAWAGMLALSGTQARKWEPPTLRHRLMTIPATIAHHARRTIIRYKARHPWTKLLIAGLTRLHSLPAP